LFGLFDGNLVRNPLSLFDDVNDSYSVIFVRIEYPCGFSCILFVRNWDGEMGC